MSAKKRRAFTPNLAIGCYTACWGCRFGQCNRGWHTSADADDMWDWEHGNLGADPSLKQCGCWCQLYWPKPLIHKGGKP